MLDLSPLLPETHTSTRIADHGNEEPRVADPSLAGRLSRFLSPQVEDNRRVQPASAFPKVSREDWAAFANKLSQFDSVLPDNYELPSRHAMTRYLHRFMNGFQPHFPILHAPTLSVKEMAPELLLAMAATGSQYCLEPHQGLKLFSYAHEIALEQIRRRDLEHQSTNRQSLSKEMPGEQLTSDNRPRQGPRMANEYGMVETTQALFYLMAMATWNVTNRSLMRHAVATPSMLAMLVRQHGLIEQSHDIPSWEDWSREESARRTKLIIFCFFNLHSIAMNLPSPIMLSEIELFLPCSESEWRAVDAESWNMLHRQSESPPLFQDYLACLNTNTRVPPCSALSSHVMIHALIQRISTLRQASLEPPLSRWQTGWEQNPESSLTPLDRHGPIAFNSTALYRLAYIRLAVDIGPARSFLEQDDVQIVHRLKQLPPLKRGPLLTLAARHALAALCPPVQMGIFFIGQGHSWSVMHAVCSLDYAYLLSQFLKATTSTTLEYPLDTDEQSIVRAAKEILSEVEASRPDGNPALVNATPGVLAAKVVRAWATILENVRTWNAVTMITTTLFTYADYLEKNVGP
ncbi:hypothetical protein ASPWEDRAFT_747605 [Aspergillus wentii DTO 134E9]|uniref:Xylanolytic transcriptional activator regulatory domain-containing protein n=1 Tax=Aspergillus wentii DTO 134E9 TaxID=1073089 RepID=A0A1L9R9U1_ASPWE|nr:uncharacterized protein ASPWEDRAFT_747605 [Aspergillus wentii DTO 134E9]OJJ31627.1 hypothetical protein ASPWEDRAFT_747605 [Aspergillus wentii DTO 134E9]